MTVNTRVIKLFLYNNDKAYVPLLDGLRLQVLPDMSHIPRCQKHQFAAFIADRGLLVVWDDEPKCLLSRAEKIERELMEMIWRADSASIDHEKLASKAASVTALDEERSAHVDSETGAGDDSRHIVLMQPLMAALTLLMSCAAIGSGWRKIALQIAIDRNFMRLAFLAVVPAQLWLALVRVTLASRSAS